MIIEPNAEKQNPSIGMPFFRAGPTSDHYGSSRPQLYKLVNEKLHTKPMKPSGKISAWPGDEIDVQKRARQAGFTKEQLLALVRLLEDRRPLVVLEECPSAQAVLRYIARLKEHNELEAASIEKLLPSPE